MNGQELENEKQPEINHEIEPQIDYLARAIELLNNKTQRETRLILTEVVKKGDVNLIESMVQVIDHPPANVVINKPGPVGMKRVYNDSLTYSRTLLKREQSDNIKKTCGMIAGFARMEVGHARRVFYNLQGSRYSSAVLAG